MVCPTYRFFEATGVPRLNAQSPSKLGWRLRVEARMICCFGSTLDNPYLWTSWIRQPPDRYRATACPFLRLTPMGSCRTGDSF